MNELLSAKIARVQGKYIDTVLSRLPFKGALGEVPEANREATLTEVRKDLIQILDGTLQATDPLEADEATKTLSENGYQKVFVEIPLTDFIETIRHLRKVFNIGIVPATLLARTRRVLIENGWSLSANDGRVDDK